MAKLKGDPEAQRAALAACSRDPVLFVNHFVWTFDPRLIAAHLPGAIPFVLFDFQEPFLRWLHSRLEERAHGVVEKSRDMGFTWIAAAFAVWMWLFLEGATICFGSRKVELVDKKKDPKCIFWKIRFIIRALPRWMKPKGWNPAEHSNWMKIVNPENGATITGEGGDQIGRGGRALMYFADEWAFVPGADEKDSALALNTEIIVYGSSANGVGNNFYRKRSSGAFDVYRLHWKQDPRKSEAWRQALIDQFGSVIVAQEVDIDYTASVEGIVIPAGHVQAALEVELEWEGSKKAMGLDIADGGADESVVAGVRGPMVELVTSNPMAAAEVNPVKTARWGAGQASAYGASSLYYDVVGVGSGVGGELADKPRPFTHVGVNFGDAPTDRVMKNEKLAKEQFRNLKAELYWNLAQRFRRTFEHVNGIKQHEPRDMISLKAVAHCQDLIAQLSIPTGFTDERGRYAIESKKDLKKRIGNDASPDHLEALVYAYAGDVIPHGILIGRA